MLLVVIRFNVFYEDDRRCHENRWSDDIISTPGFIFLFLLSLCKTCLEPEMEDGCFFILRQAFSLSLGDTMQGKELAKLLLLCRFKSVTLLVDARTAPALPLSLFSCVRSFSQSCYDWCARAVAMLNSKQGVRKLDIDLFLHVCYLLYLLTRYHKWMSDFQVKNWDYTIILHFIYIFYQSQNDAPTDRKPNEKESSSFSFSVRVLPTEVASVVDLKIV